MGGSGQPRRAVGDSHQEVRVSAAIGLQGAQSSTSVGRGLARYVADSVTALAERSPDAIAALCLDPELDSPAFVADLPAKLPRTPVDIPPVDRLPDLFHVPSPFELLPLDSVWPRWARQPEVGLVVTVHDLIPFVHPDRYLHIDNVRRWHLPRVGIVQVADAIVAISQTTADEVVERLGVDPQRIFVTHEDCSPDFRPATDRTAAVNLLSTTLPSLREGFILYVGGLDWRKNVAGLIAAYGGLAPALRSRHQLVIAGKTHPDEIRPFIQQARALGVDSSLIFTGYISDAQLIALYQSCGLFVFPSFHEGFGLPALEAMRCAAPVVVADAGALRELVTDPQARFDPRSPESMAGLITGGLTDEHFRRRLIEMAAVESARFSWDRSVAQAVRAYEFAAARRRRLLKA